jgi:hypothetical protein
MSGRWLGLAASLGLVILVNVLLLTGVARNRSGPPAARVELTERECPLSPREDDDEDTGLSFGLTWRAPDQDLLTEGTPSWLTRDTLRSLGFDVSVAVTDSRAQRFYRHALPRDAFVVLEMDGFAWKSWIAAREAVLRRKTPEDYELQRMDRERRMGTRLVAVAVGRDAEALRGNYPDRSRFLILPAKVDPYWYQPAPSAPGLNARVSLRNDDIYAPLPFRPLLERFQPSYGSVPEPDAPRYRVTLAVGSRYEPWVERLVP